MFEFKWQQITSVLFRVHNHERNIVEEFNSRNLSNVATEMVQYVAYQEIFQFQNNIRSWRVWLKREERRTQELSKIVSTQIWKVKFTRFPTYKLHLTSFSASQRNQVELLYQLNTSYAFIKFQVLEMLLLF